MSSFPDNFILDTEKISTDTRKIKKGAYYFAIKGKSFDGNRFLEEAIKKGADALIYSADYQPNNSSKAIPSLRFKDDREALLELARLNLNKSKAIKFAITGSNGKTSSKEMLATLVSSKFNTLKTAGNFNNDIGVPLSILRLKPDHEAMVMEIGMSASGEIDHLASLLKPQWSIITNVSRAHIKFLKTQENIVNAKCEIIPHTSEATIVNADNDLLFNKSRDLKFNTFYFSTGKEADIFLKTIAEEAAEHTIFSFRNNVHREDFEIRLPLPGRHNIENYLATFLAARLAEVDAESIIKATSSLKPLEGRYKFFKANNITVIDDCYNANPESMKAGLSCFTKNTGGRKIALLGDMLELGDDEENLHFEIGRFVARAGIHYLITFGELARNIEKGAISNGFKETFSFLDINRLMKFLKKKLRAGDFLYIKSSNATGLSEVCDMLKKNFKHPKE